MIRPGIAFAAASVVVALAGCAPESQLDTPAAAPAGATVGAVPSRLAASATTRPHPSSTSPAGPGDVMTMPHDLAPVSSNPSGNLGFHDQVSDGWQLVGAAEINGSGGWVVVRADLGGVPGQVIGKVYRANEAHDDVVTVRFAQRLASGALWVSLNIDAGTAKRLEFPGLDRPVQFAGADLATRLVLTVR